MSVIVRTSPSAAVWENLSLPRIAAISATASIHLVAFGFLLMPVSLPDWLDAAETRTEVTFTVPDPPKPPEPAVLRPLTPPALPRSATPPSIAAKPQVDTVPAEEATTDDPGPLDVQVSGGQGAVSDSFETVAGGDVDASTRAQYPIRYPPAALRALATGSVWVAARYDAGGTVTDTRIHRSSRSADLDRAALAGVRKWKINPGLVQGQPVGGEALVEVVFSL
ncbi:MAG: energy transducer TonB [Arenimonas sp.]